MSLDHTHRFRIKSEILVCRFGYRFQSHIVESRSDSACGDDVIRFTFDGFLDCGSDFFYVIRNSCNACYSTALSRYLYGDPGRICVDGIAQ